MTGIFEGVKYLGQEGTSCYPIALCNALRFWGLPSPEPGTPEWEIMVDLAGCRHGSVVNPELVANWLGVVRCPTSLYFLRRGEVLPAIMSIYLPDCGLHASLAIGVRPGTRNFAPDILFVNYRSKGPLMEWTPWDDVAWNDGNQEEPIGHWIVPQWRSGLHLHQKPALERPTEDTVTLED